MITEPIIIAFVALAVFLVFFLGGKMILQNNVPLGKARLQNPANQGVQNKGNVPLNGNPRDSLEWSSQRVEQMIHAWSALEESGETPAPLSVVDVKFLPYPKDQMKKAFIIGILSSKNDQQMQAALFEALWTLCQYQEDIGDSPIGIKAEKPIVSDAQKSSMGSQNTLNQALEFMAGHDAYQKWARAIENEQDETVRWLIETAKLWGLEKEVAASVDLWLSRRIALLPKTDRDKL